MRFLPFIVWVIFIQAAFAQSPHGEKLTYDCSYCHEPTDWKIIPAKMKFDHDKTSFRLIGQHKNIDCKACHSTLIFNEAKQECAFCHTDIHKGTVGLDCSQCHAPETWAVRDIINLHANSRFPLVGKHLAANCSQCHGGYENLEFQPIGVNCFDCHSNDYYNTQNPNHSAAGFSTDCHDCHSLIGSSWSAENINHDFFPLTGGHKIANCFSCHKQGTFQGLSNECYSCHKSDFESVQDPNHVAGNFPTDCRTCHNINAWVPAQFDHNNTQFALTGAHVTVPCQSCHQAGYSGTSTICYDCHQQNYNSTTNPSHTSLMLPTDCLTCHTTNPGWSPASFPLHNNYYELIGRHAQIANDCGSCHNGNYVNTPNTCYQCHQSEYNNTTNPSHTAAGFPTQCESCHNPNGWTPAVFDHDEQFFPIYSGKHKNKWNSCSDCHTNSSSFAIFSCIDCHEHRKSRMDEKHEGVSGYIYESSACLSCHPTGEKEGAFNHSTSSFPLTGAHLAVSCNQCHVSGYSGTSSICSDCHSNDYNAAANPNHQSLGISTDCNSCHTTNAGWQPALFPQHNDFYQLIGAHALISNNCNSCHQGNYNSTPNECSGCHQENYTNTTNPDHSVVGFPTDCSACHNQNAWTPATFDHDNQYFPIYSGEHRNKWNSCSDCHTNPSNYAIFSCIDCHEHRQSRMDEKHEGIAGYVYQSEACFACHPTGEKNGAFNHNLSQFPLTGGHSGLNCIQCHQTGFQGTTTICMDCHISNYDNTTNPNHQALSLPTDCIQCHTTNPNWKPALFPIHNNFYQLVGVHASISNNCGACHSGNYNSTPNTCFGCHQSNYQSAPNHTAQNYPVNCEMCHNPNGWNQTSFNHQNTTFPLTGAHVNVSCSDCHSSGFSGTPTECAACHQDNFNNAQNPNHSAAGLSTECQNCHTTSAWIPSTFNHSLTGFPLQGQHAAIQCSSCHQGTTGGLSGICFDCHQSDYNSAPNHVAQNYPTNCEMCHNSVAWNQSKFNHQNTSFPLTGAHTNVNCLDCHSGGFAGTTSICSDCHIQHYNQSTNPNHTALQLPTDCNMCHTTNPNWQPALFPIHNNFFPLIGAHAVIGNNCGSCHNGNYNNTPNTCVGCHLSNYQNTTNPNHQAAGFPVTCETCHTENSWQPSTFNHDVQYFPIFTGTHAGEWNQCTDCHPNPNNFSVFTCIDCHEHRQSRMDNKHRDVPGYVYSSPACLACHPDGIAPRHGEMKKMEMY